MAKIYYIFTALNHELASCTKAWFVLASEEVIHHDVSFVRQAPKGDLLSSEFSLVVNLQAMVMLRSGRCRVAIL